MWINLLLLLLLLLLRGWLDIGERVITLYKRVQVILDELSRSLLGLVHLILEVFQPLLELLVASTTMILQ